MKKICFFSGLLLSACMILAGCGSQAAPDPSSFFPEEAQKVAVTHWHNGQKTISTLEGEDLEPLREWADSLFLEEEITFPEGQAPGQTEEGGELFFFDFDNPELSFSYRDFGSCYLVKDDRWYPVSNPSPPPINTDSNKVSLTDLPPMVMVDGQLYYSTGQESSLDGRCGVMDGEITSTVEDTEIPTQNDQSNLGTGFSYQFAGNGSLEILIPYGEEAPQWIVFQPKNPEDQLISYHGRWYRQSDLSAETLAWLLHYNSLSEEEKLSISAVPPGLIEHSGPVETQDAEMLGQSE